MAAILDSSCNKRRSKEEGRALLNILALSKGDFGVKISRRPFLLPSERGS